MRRFLSRALLALTAAAIAAGGGCAYLDVKQREVIFRPVKDAGTSPDSYGLAYEDVWLKVPSEDGTGEERVHGWWIPAPSTPSPTRGEGTLGAPSILYLHGSRWSLGNNLIRIARWQRMGFNVLAIDYRGFGRSDGELPSEAQSYADARAAWAELRRREPRADKRFLYGHSLGGAVAIDLAVGESDAAGLIIESSFTSIRDMAEVTSYTSFLPVGLVLTQRFDSLAKVPRLRTPVLFVHGTADRWVPPAMSERLYAAAPEPKRLVLVEGGSHSNVSGVAFDDYQRAVRDFMVLARARLAVLPQQ